MDSNRIEEVFLTIAKDRFHFLKFILEGYDGLALLSSVSGYGSVVRIRYPSQMRSDLFALLSAISPQISPFMKTSKQL